MGKSPQAREHLQSLAGASLGFQEAWCLADEDQTHEDQAAQSHLQALQHRGENGWGSWQDIVLIISVYDYI